MRGIMETRTNLTEQQSGNTSETNKETSSIFMNILGFIVGILVIVVVLAIIAGIFFLGWKIHKWYKSLNLAGKILLGLPIKIIDFIVTLGLLGLILVLDKR